MHQTKSHCKPNLSSTPLIVGTVTTWQEYMLLQDPAHQATLLACDVIELRLDALLAEGITLHKLWEYAPLDKPLLITYRDTAENGSAPYPTTTVEHRATVLQQALLHAAYLDVEIANMPHPAMQELICTARNQGIVIIGSAHDFHKTPPLRDLLKLEQLARHHGADIAKFAFLVSSLEDTSTGEQLLAQATGPTAAMGMGELGAISRILYAQRGSPLLYGCLGNTPAAPGQWPVAVFRELLGLA